MARIRIYRNSFLATVVSLLGYILLFSGVISAFDGAILGGILIAAVGAGLIFLAAWISERKQSRR